MIPFTMNPLFSLSGKSSRFDWWVVSLLADLMGQLVVVGAILWASKLESFRWLIIAAAVAAEIALLWLAVAVTVRRLRDRERSLWLLLAALVPYAGWLWLLVECGFLPAPGRPRRLVHRTVTATTPRPEGAESQ
jgi:uncharacterized membrane protein YhaH (DUF805 family)